VTMLTKAAWKERTLELQRDRAIVYEMLRGSGQRAAELHALGDQVVALQGLLQRRPMYVLDKLTAIQEHPLLHRDPTPRVWSTSSRTQRQPKNKT
jgi:hypothetical protein